MENINLQEKVRDKLVNYKEYEGYESYSDTINSLLDLNEKHNEIIERIELLQKYLMQKENFDILLKENLEIKAKIEKWDKKIRKYRKKTEGLIKDNKTIFTVGDFIKNLKEYKQKQLIIHVGIKGKIRDRMLCGNPSIYGGMYDENAYGITIQYNERDEIMCKTDLRDIKLDLIEPEKELKNNNQSI